MTETPIRKPSLKVMIGGGVIVVATAAVAGYWLWPALEVAYRSNELDNRMSAVSFRQEMRLARMQPPPTDRLLELLHDPEFAAPAAVARVLGNIQPVEDRTVEALVAAMRGDDAAVSRYATEALGKVGRGRAEVTEALLATMGDAGANPDTRTAAAEALSVIHLENPGPVLDEMTRVLMEDETGPRTAILAAFIAFDGPAAPHLVKVLGSEDVIVRQFAARALRLIGPEAEPATEALIRVLRHDTNTETRHHAAAALGHIVPPRPGTVEVLIEMVDDPDYQVAVAAMISLADVAGEDPRTLALLMRLAEPGGYWSLRRTAVRAMKRIGPGAEEALPMLREIAKEDSALSIEAQQAILMITGEMAGVSAETGGEAEEAQ